MTRATQRVLGIVVLVVLGVLALPVSAFVIDGEGAENWIIVVDLVAMAAVGAVVVVALFPGLARDGATTARRAMTGAWWGLLAAFVGVVVFWLLLSGFSGA
jgi:hypothetical protein